MLNAAKYFYSLAAIFILSTCSYVSSKDSSSLPGKNSISDLPKHSKPPKNPSSNPPNITLNTTLWPDSWKTHHTRFKNYVQNREKSWPQPKIEYREPFGLHWDLIVSKDGSNFKDPKKDGIQFFRNGRNHLERSSHQLDQVLRSFSPGVYTASVWRFVKGYQHMSPPFYFTVISDKNEPSGQLTTRIKPYQPKSKNELFPNQWWYYNTDFHIWDTPDLSPRKFFTTARPFSPTAALEEIEDKSGPIAKRNLLSPELEKLLELRVYYEGKLVKKEPATGIESWTFDHGPGHYIFLIVAPDDDDGALIVARPFQAWFPDEGDGILRKVPLDTDKDGIPDYWEKWHNLDPNKPSDANSLYSKRERVTFLDYYKNQKYYSRVR